MTGFSDDDVAELLELCDDLPTEQKKRVISKFLEAHGGPSPANEGASREAQAMIEEYAARRYTPRETNLQYRFGPRISPDAPPAERAQMLAEAEVFQRAQKAGMRSGMPKTPMVPAPVPDPRPSMKKLLKMKAMAAGEIPVKGA